MHHRRARPTIRVLREDLNSDWGSPWPQRKLDQDDLTALHPLSELPHPIIAKARDSFGAQADDDNFVRPIASAASLQLLEIRQSQWRGAVWEDPESGVCWLVGAGLAKGGHEDRDDFYERVKRKDKSGDLQEWLPNEEDSRLLKQETAARLRTEWELRVQSAVLDALRLTHAGGSKRFEVEHPVPGQGPFASVDLSVSTVREDDYEADEVMVEILPQSEYAGSSLLWQLTVRILISIDPPEQGWDRFGDTFSNIGEPGSWARRAEALESLVHTSSLETSELGSVSHYAHRQHLAGQTIDGTGVRGLCGVFFVPTQDQDSLPPCAKCQERLAELPER